MGTSVLLVTLVIAPWQPTSAAAAEYWAEPRGDYLSRRRAFLEHSAAAQPSGLHSQIARLELGRPLDEGAIRQGVATVRDRKDGADFAANALLRIHSYRSPHLGDKLRQEIKQALLSFKYWMEEPGGDELLWMWNENHQINYHSAQYLAGQAFPDDVFTNNGKPGSWHKATARARLLKWIDLKAKTGFPEWDSNNCYVSIIAALLNLADLADDPDLARRSAMLLDVMFFDMAIDSFRGSYGTSHGRTYPDGITAGGLSEATTGLQRIAWGMGNPGGANNSAANYLAVGKRYKVARTIQAIASLMPEELTNRERQSLVISEAGRFGLNFDDDFEFFLLNQAGKHSSPRLIERSMRVIERMHSRLYDQVITPYAVALLGTYRELARQGRPVPDLDRASLSRVDKISYRTPDYQLSAAQDYRKGAPGSMQHIWQATLGPGTMVFALHPGPSTRHWLGRLPRVGQHRNLLFAVHDIPAERYPGPKVVVPPGAKEFVPSPAPGDETLDPRTLAVFRRAAFDEVAQAGNWTFGRKGEGYVALWSRQPATWTNDGVFGGEGLVAAGRRNIWICQLGRHKVDGPFTAWRERIAAAPVSATDTTVDYKAPGIGQARFGWEGPLRIGGKNIPLSGYARFDNAYTTTAYGQGRYVIRGAGHRLVIDFKTGEYRDEAPRAQLSTEVK
jgi:hypothetical protein